MRKSVSNEEAEVAVAAGLMGLPLTNPWAGTSFR